MIYAVWGQYYIIHNQNESTPLGMNTKTIEELNAEIARKKAQDYGFDPLDDFVKYPFEADPQSAEEFVPALQYPCSCDLQELMKYGCKCGGK